MKKLAALLVLALVSIALVACGGRDNSTTTTSGEEASGGGAPAESTEKGGGESGGGSTVDFEADPSGELAYTTTEATAKAGKVTIDFNNPQGLPHDVAIEDKGGETVGQTDLIAEEETSTTANLKPGTYTFYCTVPGHRAAGMEGTLTVNKATRQRAPRRRRGHGRGARIGRWPATISRWRCMERGFRPMQQCSMASRVPLRVSSRPLRRRIRAGP